MNGNDFLDKLELISSDFIEDAERRTLSKKVLFMRIGTIAACLCLIACSVWSVLRMQGRPIVAPEPQSSTASTTEPTTPETPDAPTTHTPPETPSSTPESTTPSEETPAQNSSGSGNQASANEFTPLYTTGYAELSASASPSDKYSTLEDLLEYLGENENHGGTSSDGFSQGTAGDYSVDTSAVQVDEGGLLVAYQDYSYHIGENKIIISDLSGSTPTHAGEIATPAQKLFVCENRLVVASYGYTSDWQEIDGVHIKLYDLSSPASPVLTDQFVQNGSFVNCYAVDGNVFLITSDGVCGCGWSRLDDISGYVPKLSKNGTAVPWGNEDISILGEPSRVRYVAVTKIDTATAQITDKQAFYGDTEEIFFGSDWLSIVTVPHLSSTQPTCVYTFSSNDRFTYTGKITPKSYFKSDRQTVRSVDKAGNNYRIIGDAYNAKYGAMFFVTTADLATKEVCYSINNFDGESYFYWDDLLWEKDRAIVTISFYRDSESNMETKFLFVNFNGLDISVKKSELKPNRVDGIYKHFASGTPLGLDPLISMGNGIYLRPNEKPDGLDIFDFTNSDSPNLIYDSLGDLQSDALFYFTFNERYDQNTFGIMVKAADAAGEYRNGAYYWNIYSVNAQSNTPYTLLHSVNLGQPNSLFAASLGFDTITQGGVRYYACKSDDTVRLLGW